MVREIEIYPVISFLIVRVIVAKMITNIKQQFFRLFENVMDIPTKKLLLLNRHPPGS